MGQEHHRPPGTTPVPEVEPNAEPLTDDEYQSILYAEADAHRRFMRTCAYFPDGSSIDDVIAGAAEVLSLNNVLDRAGTTIRTVEVVEEIQEETR